MAELVLRGEPGSSDHLHHWRCAVCNSDLQVEDGRPPLDRLLTDIAAEAIAEPFLVEAMRVMKEARMILSSPDQDIKDAVDLLWIGERYLFHAITIDEGE